MNDETQTEQVIGTNNDARLALLDQINDANDAAHDEDYVEYDENDKPIPFVVKTAQGEEQQLSDESVTEPVTEDGFTTAPQRHKIKINGVERELSTEELIARAQKIEAADQYLAEAARLRNEALAERRQPPHEDVAARQQQEVEEDLAIARAIQMGDEAEAVAAIRKIRERSVSQVPSVRPDELSRTIDERLTFNGAITKFRTDFKDVVSDPYLNKMALDMDAQLIADGDKRPYDDRYTEIGNHIRSWVSKFKPAEDTSMQDKTARKAGAVSTPKATSAKAASTVTEEKEESVSDTIASIAKARGGPQWMSGMNR